MNLLLKPLLLLSCCLQFQSLGSRSSPQVRPPPSCSTSSDVSIDGGSSSFNKSNSLDKTRGARANQSQQVGKKANNNKLQQEDSRTQAAIRVAVINGLLVTSSPGPQAANGLLAPNGLSNPPTSSPDQEATRQMIDLSQDDHETHVRLPLMIMGTAITRKSSQGHSRGRNHNPDQHEKHANIKATKQTTTTTRPRRIGRQARTGSPLLSSLKDTNSNTEIRDQSNGGIEGGSDNVEFVLRDSSECRFQHKQQNKVASNNNNNDDNKTKDIQEGELEGTTRRKERTHNQEAPSNLGDKNNNTSQSELKCRLEKDVYLDYDEFRHSACARCYELMPGSILLRRLARAGPCLWDLDKRQSVSTEDVHFIRATFGKLTNFLQWRECCKKAAECCIKNSIYLTYKQDSEGKLIDDPEKRDRFCPATWDGYSCWPDSPAGSLIEADCPDHIFYLEKKPDCTAKSSKQCFPNGSWFTRDDHEWTDYGNCHGRDIYVTRFLVGSLWHFFSVLVIGPALLILKRLPNRSGGKRLKILSNLLFWLLISAVINGIQKAGIIMGLFQAVPSTKSLSSQAVAPLDAGVTQAGTVGFVASNTGTKEEKPLNPGLTIDESNSVSSSLRIRIRSLSQTRALDTTSNYETIPLSDTLSVKWHPRDPDLYSSIAHIKQHQLEQAYAIKPRDNRHFPGYRSILKGSISSSSSNNSTSPPANDKPSERSTDKELNLETDELLSELELSKRVVFENHYYDDDDDDDDEDDGGGGGGGGGNDGDELTFVTNLHLTSPFTQGARSPYSSFASRGNFMVKSSDNDNNNYNLNSHSSARDNEASKSKQGEEEKLQIIQVPRGDYADNKNGVKTTNIENNHNKNGDSYKYDGALRKTRSLLFDEKKGLESSFTLVGSSTEAAHYQDGNSQNEHNKPISPLWVFPCWTLEVGKRITRQLCYAWMFTGAIYLCSVLHYAPAEPPSKLTKWLMILTNTFPLLLGIIYVIVRTAMERSPLNLVLKLPYFSLVLHNQTLINSLWETELDCWMLESPNETIEEIVDFPNLVLVVLNGGLFIVTLIIMCRISGPGSNRPEMSLINYFKAAGTLVFLYGAHYALVVYQPTVEGCIKGQVISYITLLMEGIHGIAVSFVFCYRTPEGKEVLKKWFQELRFNGPKWLSCCWCCGTMVIGNNIEYSQSGERARAFSRSLNNSGSSYNVKTNDVNNNNHNNTNRTNSRTSTGINYGLVYGNGTEERETVIEMTDESKGELARTNNIF